MEGLINIGFGNFINARRVLAVMRYDSAPMKRLVQTAKDENKAVDATQGRKTKAVLIMTDQTVVLSALLPETIELRTRMEADKKEQE